ncbi:hypothetical protein AURDEDRAFT_113017 [Auricularia subglabra TFB-10046 SS5]|nr:hypothetical protein AURDEDRAFT_113017 [Auricularia subglabra TFB-10046 SS5]
MAIPLSQPQPTLNGTSAPSPSSPPVQNWEHDKMLNIYIYDYFTKHGFNKAANELCQEADIDPTGRKPPIDAPQGLLYEWWVVFWEIFQAKSSKAGKADAAAYVDHQNQLRSVAQQPRPLQNGQPQQGPPPAGAMVPQRQPMMPGIPQQQQPVQPRPPGMAHGQPHLMPNGAGGPHNPQQPPMPNGTMQPGQQGAQFAVPVNPMVNGMVPPNAAGRPGAPMGMPGQPGQYGSPMMATGQPGQPGQQRPMVPMRPGMGMHPGAQHGMMPAHMQPQHQGQPPYGMRPASRAGTPGGHPHPGSPHIGGQPMPDNFAQEWEYMTSQLNQMAEGNFQHLRNQAGIGEKEDLNSLRDDQKRQLLAVFKNATQSGGRRMVPGPSTQGDPLRRGAKRSSTSPGEEASPPQKRMRQTPPPGEQQAMGMMNMGNVHGNGMQRSAPPLGSSNGMPVQIQGMNQMGHMAHAAGMGAMPGQPMMVHNAAGQPMQPQQLQQQQPGMRPGGDFQRHQVENYRQSMANMHQTTLVRQNQGQGPQQQPYGGADGMGMGLQPLNAATAQMARQQQAQKQPYGSGSMPPPGSPAQKPAVPGMVQQSPQQQQQHQHQQQQLQQHQQPQGSSPKTEGVEHGMNGVDGSSPERAPSRNQNQGNTNPGPQPYPPVPDPDANRAATTSATGMRPGAPSAPVPAPAPAAPSSAPPTSAPSLASSVSTMASSSATIFSDPLNLGGEQWPFATDDLTGMGGLPIDSSFEHDFAAWIHNDADPTGDIIGSL